MKYSDMMQKCEYTHFEAWILNGEITKQLTPIDKQAILQQVLVRDAEIKSYHEACNDYKDQLHRRNALVRKLREELRIAKSQVCNDLMHRDCRNLIKY